MSTPINPRTGMPYTPLELMQMQPGAPASGAMPAPAASPGAMPRPSSNALAGFGMGPMSGAMAGPQAQASTGQLPQTETGIDPEVQAAMLGAYGDQLELGEMDKQLAEANALRDTVLPEGRSGGGIYTAANPLEFIGAGMKQYQGIKEGKKLKGEMAPIRKGLGDKVKGYGEEILRRKKERD